MRDAAIDVTRYPDDAGPPGGRQPVLALGNFDGVHRGHARILERVVRQAAERAATPVVLTFDPHPTRIVRPDKAPPLLMTAEQRIEAFARAGLRGVALVRFTPDLARWTPETFVERVLVDWLRVAEVWVGANFLFGHDRSGDYARLRLLGSRHGFRAEKIDPVRVRESVVSSSRIRRLIGEARVDEAAALLGRHYFIDGTVVAGQRRGRQLGFPTANLETDNELLPPRGVYATITGLDETLRAGITNIGLRPTFHDVTRTVIENHLFDFAREIYGARLRVWFVRRVRDERTFDGPASLVAQITADCQAARELFGRVSL
jgi:riboflavin kinase/FMN adenylyltransferase